MYIVAGVDQLRGNTNFICNATNAPFQEVCNLQLPGNFPKVALLAPIPHNGGPADDLKIGNFGKRS